LTAVGQTAQYKAIGTFTQGSLPATTQDITSTVTWSSQNTSVAIVNSAGVVSAVANGTATISATFTGTTNVITGTSNVTVSIPPLPTLTSISILPTAGSETLTAAGQTAQYKAIGTFTETGVPSTQQDVTNNVVWSSQNTAVATVSSGGVVSAIANGNATISATYSGASNIVTGTSDVTVNIPPPAVLTSLTILPSTQVALTVGETGQYIAIGSFTGTPATQDLTSQVIWTSSDVTVGTVSATGLATALAPGTTTLTALIKNTNGATITGSATFTASAGGITLPIVTIYKVGSSASAGEVVATYTPAGGSTLTPIDCSPTASATQCTATIPVGALVTLTVPNTQTEPTFGGWSSNCNPVYSTPPTTGSPGVLAVPYACTFTTKKSGNTPVGAIFL
jgi:hypothetical protein